MNWGVGGPPSSGTDESRPDPVAPSRHRLPAGSVGGWSSNRCYLGRRSTPNPPSEELVILGKDR